MIFHESKKMPKGPDGAKIVLSDAYFSKCGRYRYSLRRAWDRKKDPIIFICLNPSTATAETNDSTVTKCMGYAFRWGYGGVTMLNVFAFRARQPSDMKSAEDPIGPDHDIFITQFLRQGDPVVCAWGNDGGYLDRGKDVVKILAHFDVKTLCLAVNKTGHPQHPLYMKKDIKPIHYDGRRLL